MITRQRKLVEIIAGLPQVAYYGLSTNALNVIAQCLFDAIAMELRQGHDVKIHTLGSFFARKRPARLGTDPNDGKKHVQVLAYVAVTFRVSQTIK
jgi:nucleoid DNA-binding protein